jgi:hypothetical protein
MSGIFHRNIDLMRVSIAVIPIMVSLNAPSLLIKIGLIRPRPNSPRMEAVVEAEVDAAAEVALPVEAMTMLVIKPTLMESGRAMMLRCLQSPLEKMEHGLQILQVEYHLLSIA